MTLTGSILLDFGLIILIDVVVSIVGVISILMIIGFIYTKIDEFFEKR